MSAPYNPADWYWFIGADTSNAWSSKSCSLVPTTDTNYVAWTQMDCAPSNAATMADLEAVLREVYPRGTMKTAAADARFRKASGGVIIQSLSPAAFLSDPTSRNTMASALSYARDNPGATTQWKMSDGTFITVIEADLQNMVNTTAGFVQSCFTAESNLVTGITGGSITTLQQIDDAFAAISNVFP
jgi:hypothetical protein